jgi:sugar/nucleoside kinase (ribokinase family)
MNYTIEIDAEKLFDPIVIAKFCNQMVEMNHHRVFPRTTLESAMFVNVEKQGVRRTALIVFQITQNEGNDFSAKEFDVEIVGVALCDEKPSEEKVLEIAKEIKAHSVALLN